MSIGTTIKKLRRERDITQEQLAEYLGITSRAVSQWECGRTAPDISQLPALANIFEVSADVLLGIDVDAKERRIQEIADKADKYACCGDKRESAKLLRAGLREFPNSFKLMRALAYDLFYPQEGETPDDAEYRTKERQMLLEKIVENCTDIKILNTAIADLCEVYVQNGRKDEALKLAEKIPDQYYSHDEILLTILHGSEQLELTKKVILNLFRKLIGQIGKISYAKYDDGSPAYSRKQIIELIKKQIAFIELFYEDGDYLEFNTELGQQHLQLALLYAQNSAAESTLIHLKSMAEATIKEDAFFENQLGNTVLPQEKRHTSLLGYNPEAAWCSTSSREKNAHDRGRVLTKACFDFIRTDPAFLSIENQLKENAKA